MPKTPIDYSKTFIYKIVCNDLSVKYTYVGHSTNFVKRKQQHKNKCNNPSQSAYNRKVYKTIREFGGFENWTMLEFEQYPCLNRTEARIRERYWYDILNADLNGVKPYISAEEKQEFQKHYYELNKDTILEKAKQYREANKDTILENIKQYNNQNKEKIAEYQKQYKEANKDKISAQRKQKYQQDKLNKL